MLKYVKKPKPFKKLIGLLVTVSTFFPVLVLAGGETPISQGFKYFTDAMYGATGISIATLSVILVGLGCLTHRIQWLYLGYTVAGIAIVFGAPTIVTGITALVSHGG